MQPFGIKDTLGEQTKQNLILSSASPADAGPSSQGLYPGPSTCFSLALKHIHSSECLSLGFGMVAAQLCFPESRPARKSP